MDLKMELQGKTAIVTGGGNGIGRAISLELASRGAAVVVADIDPAAAEGVAAEITGAGGRSIAVKCDVAVQEETDRLMERAISELGGVDILINNAGIGGASGWEARAEPSIEDWDAAFSVNVFGIVHAIQSAEPHMLERQSGRIVNIASAAGRLGTGGFAHYAASKASVINVTQAWAFKLASSGINVNSVCPGLIWTGLWEKIASRNLVREGAAQNRPLRESFDERVASMVPQKREQTPEDVAKAVAFLVSERSHNITGQSLNVDGGLRMN